MPFTLSHTAAILPFRKKLNKYFSLSGLLMGSMAPDFEYFLRITLYGKYGHTPLGIFLFDLPVSLFLCFVFHLIVKKPLIENLPLYLYNKFYIFKNQNWVFYFKKKYITVIISILVGIFTHLIWDNFTHGPNSYSPFYCAILLNKFNILNYSVFLYSILQIVSSVLGLIIFFITINNFKVKEMPLNQTNPKKIYYWLKMVVLSIFIVSIRYFIGVPNYKPVEQLVVIIISAFLISLTFISAIYKKPNEN